MAKHRDRAERLWGAGLALLVLVAVVVAATRWTGPGGEPKELLSSGQPPAAAAPSEAQKRRFEATMADAGLAVDELIESTGTYREVVVTIIRGTGVGPPSRVPAATSELSLRVAGRRSGRGPLAVERSFATAFGELLVVAVDRGGRARWATSKPDPRLIRSEAPDAAGSLSGQVVERASAELRLQLPESGELVEARVYRPAPGRGPLLELVGTIPLA